MIAAYIAGVGPILPGPDGKRCLELGAGPKARRGWLATNLGGNENVLPLDATKAFPIQDRSFDYVYSEHMIEHIPFEAGRSMLRECFRILRPEGVVRIATPSVGFLMGLFSADRTELEDRYVEWATRLFVPGAPAPMPSFVFNNFVRAWGHEFIYDRATLRLALSEAGFTNIKECRVCESEHEALRNLENIHRMADGFLALESMILEATRRPNE